MCMRTCMIPRMHASTYVCMSACMHVCIMYTYSRHTRTHSCTHTRACMIIYPILNPTKYIVTPVPIEIT